MAPSHETPWIRDSLHTLKTQLPTVGVAFAILVGGWFLAYVVQRMVFAGLKKTTIDD